ENKALREMLKLGKETGVLVRLPRKPEADNPFREFDVLTKICDHDVDNHGSASLRDGLRISFLGMIPKLASKGTVPVTVIRGGKRLEWTPPAPTNPNRLIREFEGEQPSYFIHGPLAFSPVRADVITYYGRLRPSIYYGNSPMITRRDD